MSVRATRTTAAPSVAGGSRFRPRAEPEPDVRLGPAAEFRCARCGYGIVTAGSTPSCPMCHESEWEHVPWRPFSHMLDDGARDADARRTIHADRPTTSG